MKDGYYVVTHILFWLIEVSCVQKLLKNIKALRQADGLKVHNDGLLVQGFSDLSMKIIFTVCLCDDYVY